MEGEVLIWALRVLYIVLAAAALCLAWCAWNRRNSLFRGIYLPESFAENPYIFAPKKERKARLAFLERVKACRPNCIEDYQTLKRGNEHFIEYILFLPGMAVPEKPEELGEQQLLALAETLVAPEKLAEEEKDAALAFAQKLHPVRGMKEQPVACYRFRQRLSASEYADALCGEGQTSRSEKVFKASMVTIIAGVFALLALYAASEAYVYGAAASAKIAGCFALALVFACALFAWKKKLSRMGREEKEERERLQRIERQIEEMAANQDDVLRFVFLFGDAQRRERLAQKAEDSCKKQAAGQFLRASASELLQPPAHEKAIAENTLLLIDEVDTYLAADPRSAGRLFGIVTEAAGHNGKVILSSALRPGAIEGLSERDLLLLDYFLLLEV